MCKTGNMTSISLFFKKVLKMQSPRIQCCLCTCSVLSATFGMFMLSAGVCLVLNYNFLDVDTSGLPSNLHNDEGKKVVGIILICVGVLAMAVSGLVSFVYFTACTFRKEPKASVQPQGQDERRRDAENGVKPSKGRPSSSEGAGHPHHHRHHHHHHHHHHANGGTASPAGSGSRRSGSLPNIRGRGPDPQNRSLVSLGKEGPSYSRSHHKGQGRTHTPPSSVSGATSSSRSHRRGKKGRHGQTRYKNPLAPHPEEAGGEAQSLSESRRSASSSRRRSSTDRGHVNRGAELDDDLDQARDSLASGGSSGSSFTPSVVIKVDSSHATSGASPSHGPARSGELQSELTQSSEDTLVHVKEGKSESRVDRRNEEEEEEEESGRMSRSTMDSLDAASDTTPEESFDTKQKKLDTQMQQLIV